MSEAADPISVLSEAEVTELAFQCFRKEVREILDDYTELLFRNKYYEDALTLENLEKIAIRLNRALVDFP